MQHFNLFAVFFSVLIGCFLSLVISVLLLGDWPLPPLVVTQSDSCFTMPAAAAKIIHRSSALSLLLPLLLSRLRLQRLQQQQRQERKKSDLRPTYNEQLKKERRRREEIREKERTGRTKMNQLILQLHSSEYCCTYSNWATAQPPYVALFSAAWLWLSCNMPAAAAANNDNQSWLGSTLEKKEKNGVCFSVR